MTCISMTILAKDFLKSGLASLVLFGTVVPMASATEKDVFNVSVSRAVQNDIQNVSTDERKKLETAVKIGNKFVPYHFDGRAHDVNLPEDWKFWLKNIRPLTNKDVDDWHITEMFPPSTRDLTVEEFPRGPGNIASVCPQIELVSITAVDKRSAASWKIWYPKSFAEDSFVLEYRAKIIGVLDGVAGPPRYFIPIRSNAFETVLISLDKNNKVSQIASDNADWTWTAERQMRSLTQRISGISADSTTADDKARLKQMIQQIRLEKMKVCTDTHISNQSSIKE